MTLTALRNLLDARFGSGLLTGMHSPDSQVCALELLSQAQNLSWTDDPEVLRTWDLRPLNDTTGPTPKERADAMLPLLVVYEGARDWPMPRQQAVVKALVMATIREIIDRKSVV